MKRELYELYGIHINRYIKRWKVRFLRNMFFIYLKKLINFNNKYCQFFKMFMSEINSHDKCDFLIAYTISERYELLIHFLLPCINPTGCCADMS